MSLKRVLFAGLLLAVLPDACFATNYAVCYFNNAGTIAWQWGLNSDNSYFSMAGTWAATPYTDITKFTTTQDYSTIYQSCVQAQSYYGTAGSVFAIFAATSSTGSSYPIVLGSGELYPQF